MTAILGISAFYHDSAAALVVDGKVVAAAQEERFSRKKHDHTFPKLAIDYCLTESGLTAADIEYAVFYEKPILKFERLLQTHLAFVPAGYRTFRKSIPLWLNQKLHLRREIRQGLGDGFHGRCVFTEHHESHAASAFFASPFEEAAILTMDGVGEWATTCMGIGRGNRIELTNEIRFPHSLGLLYSAFTAYCGFRVNNGEYKLMGLAPYGEPRFKEKIVKHLVDLKDDGSFRLDMSYFDFGHALRMTSRKFEQLFEGPTRQPESAMSQRIMDVAASIQLVTEEIVLRLARHIHSQTSMKHLVLAGGVALNCVANGRLRKDGPFDNVWVQPASGDSGGALGAAMFVWHQLLERSRDVNPHRLGNSGVFLGPAFADDQVASHLIDLDAEFATCESDEQLCDQVAEALNQQKVVGWFQGRMEFSPRALGSRSILADARDASMQSKLNQKIKFRESFRPFAPAVLREFTGDWFDVSSDEESPFMNFVADVQPSRRNKIPSVTHHDGSARLQTVDKNQHPLFHKLLSAFEARTGCPVLINTSFNLRGEPIVCTPQDAYRCFVMSDMDMLVVGRIVVKKSDQKSLPDEAEQSEYRAKLQLGNKTPSIFNDIERNPGDKQLRLFSLGFIVMLPLVTWFWGGGRNSVASMAALGVGIAGTGVTRPRLMKPLFVGMSYLAAPVQWLLREVALLVVYTIAFVPIGLLFRWTKRDALKLKWNEATSTYWEPRPSNRTKSTQSYFRQF